jgi:hypothetical protein
MSKGNVSSQMEAGRIVEGGKITSLSAAFSKGGNPFSLFVLPNPTGTASDDTVCTVNCKLYQSDVATAIPFTMNCWDVPLVSEISATGIDLDVYDVYWGAGTEIQTGVYS